MANADEAAPGREIPPDGEFAAALQDAIEALEDAGVPYLLMGGLGSAAMGRPRKTHDIDFFVSPAGRGPALQALEKAGFSTEETDPRWLNKAFKYGVLVDVIFRSKGEIYLDDEMLARGSRRSFGRCHARVMAPEDLIVIKAITADEHVPHQWYDALALLSAPDLDWDYLLRRGRHHGVRRLLSLLLYAESNDVWVPQDRIRALFATVHDEQTIPP